MNPPATRALSSKSWLSQNRITLILLLVRISIILNKNLVHIDIGGTLLASDLLLNRVDSGVATLSYTFIWIIHLLQFCTFGKIFQFLIVECFVFTLYQLGAWQSDKDGELNLKNSHYPLFLFFHQSS